MNIINHFPQSIGTFLDNILDLSPRNKMIAAIAAAVFTAIAAIYYVFLHCSYQTSLQVTDLSSDDAKEELGLLSEKINEIAQKLTDCLKGLDKINRAFEGFESRMAEMEEFELVLEDRINQLQKEGLSKPQTPPSQSKTPLSKPQTAPLTSPSFQPQSDQKTFNDKYCVLDSSLSGKFPKGIKFDAFYTEKLLQKVAEYPNLKFFFTLNFGPEVELNQGFIEAVKRGKNDAMWCVVVIQDIAKTTGEIYQFGFAKGKCCGNKYPFSVFTLPVGLQLKENDTDNILSAFDNYRNQQYYFSSITIDLKDEEKRNEVMKSTQLIKAIT